MSHNTAGKKVMCVFVGGWMGNWSFI